MVKLKEGKLKWALTQKNKKNSDLAFICEIKVRRFQQLKQEFKESGVVPALIKFKPKLIRFVYQYFEVSRKLRKLLGMGIRRFFEGYYPEIELPPKLKQPKFKRRIVFRRGGSGRIAPTSNIDHNVGILKPSIVANGHLSIDQYIEIQKTLKEIKDKVGTENIKKILQIL